MCGGTRPRCYGDAGGGCQGAAPARIGMEPGVLLHARQSCGEGAGRGLLLQWGEEAPSSRQPDEEGGERGEVGKQLALQQGAGLVRK